MPYSGPDDSKLPDHIKKMNARKRRMFVAIWNDVFARCQKSGGKDCEAMAFRMANGRVKS